jgi:pyruvate formate lyase activating enzyme
MKKKDFSGLNFFFFSEIVETLKDHPNKYALEIFTTGCNFKCFHCHNYEEVNTPNAPKYGFNELLNKLKELVEIGIYDLLIICGGEPTIYGNRLVKAIEIFKKELNIPIRLDTNGSNPKVLKELIDKNLIDGVAMDIKFPYWKFFDVNGEKQKKYEKIIGIPFTKILQQKLLQSIDLIIENLDNEYSLFRTVKYPLLDEEDLKEIKNYLTKKGWKSYYQVNEFKYVIVEK